MVSSDVEGRREEALLWASAVLDRRAVSMEETAEFDHLTNEERMSWLHRAAKKRYYSHIIFNEIL